MLVIVDQISLEFKHVCLDQISLEFKHVCLGPDLTGTVLSLLDVPVVYVNVELNDLK